MDPITVATHAFLRQLERSWKIYPGRVARLIAHMRDRPHVIKALRLAEYDPANRRPLFLYEAAFTSDGLYFDGLCDRMLADYALLQKGAAEEGVALPSLAAPARAAELTPDARAAVVMAAVADRLAARLDGAVVALVPEAVIEPSAWCKAIERLAQRARPAGLRVAVLDPEDGPLSEVLGKEGARFAFDIDELFDFAEQQAKRPSDGPNGSQAPVLSPEQRDAYERASGRKLAAPETAARLQSLYLKAARAAAKNEPLKAAQAYREARELCRAGGLLVEEAGAAFALAGAYLAAGSRSTARTTFGEAALLAAQAELWSVACQAKLGEAGVGWMEKDHTQAARAYAEAARLAERASAAPLEIEALRMEGLCHQQRGAEADAIGAWRRAIDAGGALDAPARRASTFREVVTSLAEVLDRRGLRPQAAHLRSLLDSDGSGAAGVRTSPA